MVAGRDGLTAEMVSCDILVDFWWCLFNWCWKFGMILSEWRKSVVVPIPKKQNRGPCRVDEFRGISLVAVPYKALCSIVHKRMVEVVEEKGLVAEEQGGFRRGRGCRDQVLTLMLLGQIKARSRRRMFATFIDLLTYLTTVFRSQLPAAALIPQHKIHTLRSVVQFYVDFIATQQLCIYMPLSTAYRDTL